MENTPGWGTGLGVGKRKLEEVIRTHHDGENTLRVDGFTFGDSHRTVCSAVVPT